MWEGRREDDWGSGVGEVMEREGGEREGGRMVGGEVRKREHVGEKGGGWGEEEGEGGEGEK